MRLYQHLNNFKCKNSKLQESRSLKVLKFWYTKCLHLTTNKKYINFLMRQVKVRDYYGAVILYNFFEHLNIVKWKKIQNYKIVDLVEGYNFHIKIIFIRCRIEELWFFRRFNQNKLEKEKNKTVVTLANPGIKIIFIRCRIEELWFFYKVQPK